MGYRSEAYIGIVKEQQEEFEKLNKDKSFSLPWVTDTHYIYYGEYLKWYDIYEDVIEMNKLIRSNEDNFCMAIGEENEIHSEIGEWYRYVEAEVTITPL
jgi:hypothetical protein